uniref:Odorant receptor n=1 Tax=Chenopodium quinoa TaxID=63459 RepID=A0A803L141_CHEQI
MENEKKNLTPLLLPPKSGTHHQNHPPKDKQEQAEGINDKNVIVDVDGEEVDTQLDETLKKFEFFLRFLCFDQTNPLKFVVSWFVFFVVGVAIPVLIIELTHCLDCEDYLVKDFEYEILTSHLILAGVLAKGPKPRSLKLCNLGSNQSKAIEWVLHEIMRMIYVQNHSWWLACFNATALVIPWTYLSAISLAACILFHLACNLQVIHFNDYAKLLESESSIMTLMDEHMRLREYLSKISHRFRIYLILIFLFVTASLCMTLIQITGINGRVTFLNGGNFAVTSIVQVVETLLCLHAGTKISSRAHAIGSVASRWHALVTCKSLDAGKRSMSMGSLTSNYSDSESNLLDENAIISHSQFASVSSYNKRQSFVMYLQTNPGGLTLYGWTVDRSLLSTIFAIELSLVLFVLGQTIVFSSPSDG